MCKHYNSVTIIKLINTSIIILGTSLLKHWCRPLKQLSRYKCLVCKLGNLRSIPRARGKEITGSWKLSSGFHTGIMAWACLILTHTAGPFCIFQSDGGRRVSTGSRTRVQPNRAGGLWVQLSGLYCVRIGLILVNYLLLEREDVK